MRTILRLWTGLAAIGASLVHLALGAGDPFSLLGVFVLVGAAELVWGALAIARPALPFRRLAAAGAAVAILTWLLGMAVAAVTGNDQLRESLAFVPLAVASGFDLFVLAMLLTVLRRPAERDEDPAGGSRRGIATFLGGLVVGAFVMGWVSTSAIELTPYGASVSSGHGGHGGGTPAETPMPQMDHEEHQG